MTKRAKLVAVAGKGGTGKTTVTALTIRGLLRNGVRPILAVDADPNATLAPAIGMEINSTIGAKRQEFFGERAQIPPGMPKEAWLELKLNETISEGKGLDLLTMGRPEGPGCYCYVNNITRMFLDRMAGDYPVMVIDNEAGMEHLSRRNTRAIDVLIMVADASARAVRSAGRISDLADEMEIQVARRGLVVNRIPAHGIAPELQREIEATGLDLWASISEDRVVVDFDLRGESLLELPDDSGTIRDSSLLVEKVLADLR